MSLKSLMVAASAVCILVACSGPGGAINGGKPEYGTFGFDTVGMDRNVAAGDDFFSYANGGWVKSTPIPNDKSSWNTFSVLAEKSNERVKDLITHARENRDPDAGKVADFYAALMDEAAIEARGMEPLRPELAKVAALSDRKAISAYIGAIMRADVDPLNATNYYTDRPLGLWVAQDLDEPERYVPYLMQGGLGMPDRDFYLDNGARFATLRTQYLAHIVATLKLAGIDKPEERAARIMALETRIARTHWSQLDTGDVQKANNTWDRAEFATKAPGMDWNAFFEASGLSGADKIKVWQASAVTGLAGLVGSESLESWKDYLTFHAINRGAPNLSKAFVDQHFEFYGKALSGQPEPTPRWKRAIALTNSALGDAVGRMYVAKYFPPEAKAAVEEMVVNIKAAMGKRIEALSWMTPETKVEAHAKLESMRVGVGYPNKWRDYSALTVSADDAYGNLERASLVEYRRQLAKLGQPVDRDEWFMVPQEVNALFAPSQNSIIFPAAILEPTFFDPNADPAVNYGAIGGVIGHEISHGFDNLGSQFDSHGRLRDWWTASDKAQFNRAADMLATQFDGYKPFEDAAVNGRLTLGENIADVAGLSAAYDAWKLSLGGKEAPVLDGFTGDQRFFLGWAQNYRAVFRDAALRNKLMTDVHAPGPYRAQTVRNLDAWYSAFDVKPEQKLYLDKSQRVPVW
ncbi:M13 family metallopeptidase [uncultured Brevundimonas sp.]|uniref:M13 family metallopeptidase n=1 Tax=uncultured Brevundimonas sp. TaxID=213418 RepID=UPI00262B537F|nr:M13 family metallopeptidase [uncultured Brevundimonas sp.]